MSNVVILSGSPSATSKSAALADECLPYFRAIGIPAVHIRVRDLPADDLIFGRAESAATLEALRLIDDADAVIVATPIYKAAYSGVLKVFLDLLPQKGLAGKIVLPISTSGSLAHLLAIDYSLRPVLSALGARNLMHGITISDADVKWNHGEPLMLGQEIRLRLVHAIDEIILHLLDKPQTSYVPDNIRAKELCPVGGK